jgi:hypothetical protein
VDRSVVVHSSSVRVQVQVYKERPHAVFDLVADRADCLEVLASWVEEVPVLVAGVGEETTGVATAHGRHDICGVDDLVGSWLRKLAGDVDADLGNSQHRGLVDLLARLGPT